MNLAAVTPTERSPRAFEPMAGLRVEDLEEVAALARADGVGMDAETWLVGGSKPPG